MVEITPHDSEKGSVIVSRDVLATIAGQAALEIEGVYAPREGQFTDFVLSKKYRSKPYRWVNVDYTEEELELTLHIVVKHGLKVVKISEDVQQKVKQAIETMTGTTVSIVNVALLGVVL